MKNKKNKEKNNKKKRYEFKTKLKQNCIIINKSKSLKQFISP